MKPPRPKYHRAEVAPPLRFQARDGEILRAVQAYDGVLAKRQLKALFWPAASQRAMEMRLSLLYHQGYLDWPSLAQWRTRPIPEPVCWLGWKGAAWLAGEALDGATAPSGPRENQLRRLARQLQAQGLRWLREPRWSQLGHDLALVDFRLAVERAVQAAHNYAVESWVTEGAFLSQPDTVAYRDAHGKLARKQVRPDGYFVLLDADRLRRGLPARARYLIELDMATHDLGSFGREKVLPGLAYLQSEAYAARFGSHAGRWLVVTTTCARREHLQQQTAAVGGGGARCFLFGLLADALASNPLTSAIWHVPGEAEPVNLVGAR